MSRYSIVAYPRYITFLVYWSSEIYIYNSPSVCNIAVYNMFGTLNVVSVSLRKFFHKWFPEYLIFWSWNRIIILDS